MSKKLQSLDTRASHRVICIGPAMRGRVAMNRRIPGSDPRCLALRAAAIMLAIALQACAPLLRLGPVPEVQTEQAVVPGMADSRIWMDRDLTSFVKVVLEDNARERSALLQAGRPTDPLPPIYFLSISGGGDNGAFAAGVFAGWSDSRARPGLQGVNRHSPGGLNAPVAILGPGVHAD